MNSGTVQEAALFILSWLQRAHWMLPLHNFEPFVPIFFQRFAENAYLGRFQAWSVKPVDWNEYSMCSPHCGSDVGCESSIWKKACTSLFLSSPFIQSWCLFSIHRHINTHFGTGIVRKPCGHCACVISTVELPSVPSCTFTNGEPSVPILHRPEYQA